MAGNPKIKNLSEAQRRRKLIHSNGLINLIILSTAGLAITWCTYQSTLWSGIQTFSLARSNAAFREAQERKEELLQRIVMDEGVIISFINSVMANDTQRAKFYVARVKPELSAAMTTWIKQDPLKNKSAPLHPGLTEEYQQFLNDRYAQIKALKEKGYTHFNEAQRANKISDNYVLVTVVFSVVMFLCGLAPKKATVKLSFTLNIISAIICLGMLIVVFLVMPMATE